MSVARQFFLAGKWEKSEKKLPVTYPYNNKVIAEVYLAEPKHVEAAIKAAVSVQEELQNLPSYKRYDILISIAQGIAKNKEDLAKTITLECGKSITDSRLEVSRAVSTFTLSAEEAKRRSGEFFPADLAAGHEGRWAIVRRFPFGVISGITPFNFPLNLVAHKIGPAIAAGCPIILKPASKTPLSALKLAELFAETDLPKGALSVLPGDNKTVSPLITDPRIKVLSFTGSTVGWKLKQQAGDKKVILELGGNAGVIIDEDALDLPVAAKRVTQGGFALAGQSCISVQRVYVHQNIFKKFCDLLKKEVSQLKEGDPLDDITTLTPMIEEAAAKRTEEWVKEAVGMGAKIMIGGKRKGNFFEATVLLNAPPRAKVCSEEVFAPVITLEPFTDFKKTVAILNNSWYGLQAGIFSSNIQKIWYAFEHIQVGGVILNDVPTYRADAMPYGGTKGSGIGREGPKYAIEEFTEQRTMILKLQ